MGRSVKPTLWFEPPLDQPAPRGRRLRREVNGRRLPSIPVGQSVDHAKRILARETTRLWEKRLDIAVGNDRLFPFLAGYLTERRRAVMRHELTARTVDIDEWALGFLKEYAQDIVLSAIDDEFLAGFEDWLRKRPYRKGRKGKDRIRSQNGIRIILKPIKTALRHAYKKKRVAHDPFLGYSLPPEIEVAHPPTAEEVHAFWPHLPIRARRALAAAAFLGFRRSELFRIHGPKSTSPSRLLAPSEPGQSWRVQVQKAKTRARDKTEYKILAVPDEAIAAMAPIPEDGPVFDFRYRLLQSDLQRALRRAGLGRIRLHDFRHRWLTELMNAVKDEYAAMQNAGLKTRAALSRYQHGTPDRDRANLKVSGRIVLPSPAAPPQEHSGETGKADSPS